MGGRNKIDIVRTLGDKLVIDFLQAFDGNFLAEAFTADVIVLAENTVQVAAGKENRTAPLVPLMTGSSHICRPARATIGARPTPQLRSSL